jgi:hypothetical protein
VDLDIALQKQEDVLMALFYACQSAEAERDVALAVKAEPAVEFATS